MRCSIATIVAASLFACVQIAAEAQTYVKPPKRLPPNVSDTSRIPAGTDSGSPATSDAVPLGTPVPPAGSIDRLDQRTRSAAARAAARPRADVTTSQNAPAPNTAAECATGSEASFRIAMSACSNIANRADRASCAARAAQDRRDTAPVVNAAPVALPGSGFVGSSATGVEARSSTGSSTSTRKPAQLGCV